MRYITLLILMLISLPAAAGQWKGDMLAKAGWNEETRLENIRHYPRPTDVFAQKRLYWRPNADMFDRTAMKQAPRTDMFPQKHRARPGTKLFAENF